MRNALTALNAKRRRAARRRYVMSFRTVFATTVGTAALTFALAGQASAQERNYEHYRHTRTGHHVVVHPHHPPIANQGYPAGSAPGYEWGPGAAAGSAVYVTGQAAQGIVYGTGRAVQGVFYGAGQVAGGIFTGVGGVLGGLFYGATTIVGYPFGYHPSCASFPGAYCPS